MNCRRTSRSTTTAEELSRPAAAPGGVRIRATRNEPSGTLHGLMRVRNFVQDDAHIFCTEEQILSEVLAFNDLLFEVYRDFGFDEVLDQAVDKTGKTCWIR